MKIIVIGINHAGTSAIRTLLSQKNSNLEVIGFDRNSNISFLGCGIALSISSVVKNVDDLFYSSPQELEKMGAKIKMEHEIIKIDHINKKVLVKDLKTNKEFEQEYDKLIYAGGSWPYEIQFQNDHLKNIEICKLFQHAQNLIKKANEKEINSVAIIGAGYIGVELAEAFNKKGKKVYLIDQSSNVVANYFDDIMANNLKNALIDNGINLMLNTKVLGFDGKEKVEKIITSNGEVNCDLVIKCIGFKPNTTLLNCDKLPNGAIIVNEFMQTTLKDIYAIGDCCAIYNAASKEYENISLATNAVKGGIVAASNILGNLSVKLKSIVGTNAIHIYDQNLASTGLNELKAKKLNIDYLVVDWSDNDRPEFMNEYESVSIRLIYENKTLRLLGAQIWSNGKKEHHMETIFYLATAIQNNQSIIDIALSDVYFLPHYNKPFNFVIGAILKALGMNYLVKK